MAQNHGNVPYSELIMWKTWRSTEKNELIWTILTFVHVQNLLFGEV